MSKEIEQWAERMHGLIGKMKEAAPREHEGEQREYERKQIIEKAWLDLGGIATQALIRGTIALEAIAKELQEIRSHLEGVPVPEEFKVSKSGADS